MSPRSEHPQLRGSHASRGLELRFSSDPANLAPVRHAIESLSTVNGFDEQAVWEIGLCVNEALANVMRHAYRGAIDFPVEVKAACLDDHLRIDIRDWGTGDDPGGGARVYDPLTPGGLGLICMRQLMDRVDWAPQPDGMLLSLEKRRRGAASATEDCNCDGALK